MSDKYPERTLIGCAKPDGNIDNKWWLYDIKNRVKYTIWQNRADSEAGLDINQSRLNVFTEPLQDRPDYQPKREPDPQDKIPF